MKEIIDFIQPFSEFKLEINEFNFKNKDGANFWDFIKKQNHKGVYIFIDSDKQKKLYLGNIRTSIKKKNTVIH